MKNLSKWSIKAIAFSAFVLFVPSLFAQEKQTVVILKQSGAGEADSVSLEGNFSKDRAGSTNISKGTITSVEVSDGHVTITTDAQGQVTTSTYGLGRTHKRNKGKFFWDSYFDLAYNRTANSSLFSGNQHSSADNFPEIRSNRSASFAMYPALVGIRLFDDKLSVVTGLGLEWLNYRFINNMTLMDADGVTIGVPASRVLDGVTETSLSKMMVSYLNLPIWFKTNFGNKKRDCKFYLMAGLTLGLKLNNNTKIEYYQNGNRQRVMNYERLNVAPVRYGLAARAGYGVIGVTASYYMTPLFTKDKGPQVYPYLIGISLSPF